MAYYQTLSWHDGETAMHQKLNADFYEDNPTSPFLTPRAAHLIQRYSLMALGTLDADDNPWCTVWGTGSPPLSQPVGQSVIGVRSDVDASFDPVVKAIYAGKDEGEVVRDEEPGRLISAVSIHLEERGRVKLAGRIVAGALSSTHAPEQEGEAGAHRSKGKSGQAQLVIKIEQSLGNCPKYLNKKVITSSTPSPTLISTSNHLTDEALSVIERADLFFVSSVHEHEDMDTNHRGGPPGFLRAFHSPDGPTQLIWPEYSGNNLYQTLGNLQSTPRAGIVVPDFATGDVLYVTGTTEILIGKQASEVMPKSSLAVRLTIKSAIFVSNGLPFRGTPTHDATNGLSPYNPRVRYLTSEHTPEFSTTPGADAPVTAQLVSKVKLTPTINRYRFSLSDPSVLGPWKPGQYVAMDLSKELDMGYSHMRDDDPKSLNDDYIRTFTVSSIPGTLGIHGEEFEVTVRKVGSVTGWLDWQRAGRCEIGIRAFGGEFKFENAKAGKKNAFIAAGIGITPLLGQMGEINTERFRAWWTMGIKDAGLALQVLTDFPVLKDIMTIFITGNETQLEGKEEKRKFKELVALAPTLERRRLQKDDLVSSADEIESWYLCTAPAMRTLVQEWLPGKSILYENFNY